MWVCVGVLWGGGRGKGSFDFSVRKNYECFIWHKEVVSLLVNNTSQPKSIFFFFKCLVTVKFGKHSLPCPVCALWVFVIRCLYLVKGKRVSELQPQVNNEHLCHSKDSGLMLKLNVTCGSRVFVSGEDPLHDVSAGARLRPNLCGESCRSRSFLELDNYQ